jgi:hypothetical protein
MTLTWTLGNWHVDVQQHPIWRLWFGRVTKGSVVQAHRWGLTKRQAYIRALRYAINHQ